MEYVCTIVRNRVQIEKIIKIAILNTFAALLPAFVTYLACGIGFPSQADAAQATLSWVAPTTHTDGTPINGLSGYKVYTGTVSGSYSSSLDVGNVTSYTLSNLNSATTYYFAVTAYDTSGGVSGFSNQVSYTTPQAAPLYTITASAASGGSISPSGSVAISQGLSQKFTINPNTGYKIAGVTVDGASAGAVSTYTFSNVAANHTISATFAANTVASYTISASAGTGGSISPAGTASVSSGGSQTYAITPNSGYTIAAVTVDGASVGAVSSYTFSNVAANHTISATFAANSMSSSTSITGSGTWQNQSFPSQSGVFTASFDMIPNANSIDGLTVLSASPIKAFSDGAAIVRFNTSGTIDARKGSAYAADKSVTYTSGKTYHVRMVVNVTKKVYDVYVTPQGGSEIHLATGYAFRTEQSGVSALSNLGVLCDVGSDKVLNFSITN